MPLSNRIIKVLAALFLYSSLIFSTSFTDSMVTPKRFFVFGAFSVFLLFVCINKLAGKNKLHKTVVRLNRSDYLVGLLFAYVFTRAFSNPNFNFINPEFIVQLIVISLYFVGRFLGNITKADNSVSRKQFSTFHLLLVLLLFIQSAVGLLQYAGILQSFNANFPITGVFNNPGPYAIFLAALLPFAVGLFLSKEQNRYSKLFAILTVLSASCAIVLSESRTAWIAGFAGVSFLLAIHFSLLQRLSNVLNSPFRKIISVIIVITLLAGVGYSLFQFKKGSALGRTFIWSRSVEMIADKPLFGFGFARFQPEINNYKASYFQRKGSEAMFSEHADNVSYAFNDYLQFSVDFGLVGLALFLALLLSVLSSKSNIATKPYKGLNFLILAKTSLIVISISSLFSYPMQKTPVASLFFLLLGILSACHENEIKSFSMPRSISSVLAIAGILFSSLLTKYTLEQFQAQKTWKQAFISLHKGKTSLSLKKYAAVYPSLKHDKYFLFNYGSELSVLGKYQESIPLLRKAKKLINDADVYNYLGNSYEGLENYPEAIAAFEKSSLLVPFKFYPKYRLISLYYGTGERQKAISLAKNLLSIDEKVSSEAIDAIKQDIKVFLKTVDDNKSPN